MFLLGKTCYLKYENICSQTLEFIDLSDKKPFAFLISDNERKDASTRRKRSNARKDAAATAKLANWRRHQCRLKQLKNSRTRASLAQGLIKYREKRGLSKSQLAQLLGVTRRALFNYESGKRSVPGDVLERLFKEGDAELNEYFAVPPEQPPTEKRRDAALLAIDLLRYCHSIFPEADAIDLREVAAEGAAKWQTNVKTTDKNLKKMAAELVDGLKDRYGEQWLRNET